MSIESLEFSSKADYIHGYSRVAVVLYLTREQAYCFVD